MEKINKEKVVICNSTDRTGGDDYFNLWGSKQNVNMKIEALEGLFPDIPDRFRDFLEIATYVYCTDQLYKRYQGLVDPHGLRWHRNLRLVVAVRELDFWKQKNVKECLERLLSFLSDERIVFEFIPLSEEPPRQLYLDLQGHWQEKQSPTQVMLYSGGLDSLGGAITEVLDNVEKVVLVRHESTHKFISRHRNLDDALSQKCGKNQPVFITQKINKNSELSNEYTQCTRSFLYFAIGATVSSMLRLDRVRFYENGPVSINLPLAQQVIGGRATRTTHPKVLSGFQKLISLIADKPFAVENPFLKMTKKEIIDLIVSHNCGDLIRLSTSCAHTGFSRCSNEQPQCGVCSQCIDRRFALHAGNHDKYETAESYKFDIFHGNLSQIKTEDKMTLTCYIERAVRLLDMKKDDFAIAYPEVAAATNYMNGNPAKAFIEIYNLYQKHAREVNKVIEDVVKKSSSEIIRGTLPAESLPRILSDNTEVRIETVIPEKEKPVPYLEKIVSKDVVVWKVNGEARRFNYGAKSLQGKFLNILYTGYKFNSGWIPHKTFQDASGWDEKQYRGSGKENNSGLAQKRMSDIRNALGINIAYDRKEGFMVVPPSSPETSPD